METLCLCSVCNSKLAAILIISIILEHLTFICNFHRKLLARIFLFNLRFQCIRITHTHQVLQCLLCITYMTRWWSSFFCGWWKSFIIYSLFLRSCVALGKCFHLCFSFIFTSFVTLDHFNYFSLLMLRCQMTGSVWDGSLSTSKCVLTSIWALCTWLKHIYPC